MNNSIARGQHLLLLVLQGVIVFTPHFFKKTKTKNSVFDTKEKPLFKMVCRIKKPLKLKAGAHFDNVEDLCSLISSICHRSNDSVFWCSAFNPPHRPSSSAFFGRDVSFSSFFFFPLVSCGNMHARAQALVIFCFMGEKRWILCPFLSFPLVNKTPIVAKNSSASYWEAFHSSPSKFRGVLFGSRSLTVFIWIIDAWVSGLLSLWLMACASASFSSAAIPPPLALPFLSCF